MSQPQSKPQSPPFTISDLKNAIPAHCWERNALRSLLYFFLDTVIILLLFLLGSLVMDKYLSVPSIASALPIPAPISYIFAFVIYFSLYGLYWFLQGTMFWAYFVVGHDCGHRSFSSNDTLNFVLGTWCHSVIFVPFAAWRYSHRLHHANTGHLIKDETYRAIPKKKMAHINFSSKTLEISDIFDRFPGILVL